MTSYDIYTPSFGELIDVLLNNFSILSFEEDQAQIKELGKIQRLQKKQKILIEVFRIIVLKLILLLNFFEVFFIDRVIFMPTYRNAKQPYFQRC